MNRIIAGIIMGLIIMSSSCKIIEPGAFAFGNFESEEVIVSAESSGRIMEFSLNEGMDITIGDYIGFIDTTQLYLKKLQLKSGINSVNARFKQLDQQLVVNEVSMNNLVREKNRVTSLLSGNAATTRQLDDINGQIDLLKAQTNALAVQKASLSSEKESLEIQILQINDLINKSLIKSPISGTVLEKYLMMGELAVTGKPLFKIADISSLILRVFVSGSQIEKLELGEEVDVFMDSGKDELKKYSGTISWISAKSEFTPKIIQTKDERINLVYAVKVRVPNDGSLKIGMPGEVHLKSAR